MNESTSDVHFLVISHPSTRGDRVEHLIFNEEVAALLEACDLPISDLRNGLHADLFGLRTGKKLVGLIGIEHYGTVGLLRSLAVDETHRNNGHGQLLLKHAESWAAQQGIQELFLLTTTAENFFARLGYGRISRSDAPAVIAGTTQFVGLCPSTSAFMHKVLPTHQPGESHGKTI